MANDWDAPPTDDERIQNDPWAAPPVETERVQVAPKRGGGFDPEAYFKKVSPTAEEMRAAYLWAKGRKGDSRANQILQQLNIPVATSDGLDPTLDATNTGLFHFARHVAAGLGDKIIAAEAGGRDVMADKTGSVSFGDAYRRNLAFNDKLLEASDEAHPVARWVGNAAGFAGNLAVVGGVPAYVDAPVASLAAAPTIGQVAAQGAKVGAVLGGMGGFGADRSDNVVDTLMNTGAGTVLGGLTGGLTPYASKWLGVGAKWLGGKAADLAGWLKLHSLHPVPTLGEKMAGLPGGEVGVGKELLERGIGGLTKKGTAAQIDAAKEEAGKAITDMAKTHDALGGPKISLNGALLEGWKKALAMKNEPTTEAAGKRLWDILDQYENKYSMKPTSATEALALKRTIAKAAYGASDQLHKTGDVVAGNLGEGLAVFERAIDDALDKQLGPGFAAANLAYRRLLGAGQAAERSAARTQGNAHIIGGLIPTLVGGGVMAAGHSGPEAMAFGLGSSLLQKYGSQAGARVLYGPVRQGLNLIDLALGRVSQSPNLASIASSTAASQRGQ